MDDTTWSALMAISISLYALAVAADRGWLNHAAELAQWLANVAVRRRPRG